MTITSSRRAARGAVLHSERALAPDLARGSMLLIIALANCAGAVFVGAPGFEAEPQGGEGIVNLLMFTLMHARGYPVFAVMFGYGLVQLSRRQVAAGASPAAVRSVLLRRTAWLVAFGLVHAVLLYSGDFLGAYGVIGIVMTLVLLNRGNRTHRVVLWLWALSLVYTVGLGVVVAVAILSSSGGSTGMLVPSFDSGNATDYVSGLVARIGEWPLHTLTVLPFIMIVWLGTWAAHHHVLEEPGRHVRLLGWTAGGGLAVAFAGGLPMGMVSAEWLHVDSAASDLVFLLYNVSGMFAGPGYVALFGLVALRLSRRTPGPVARALGALGQRSLSGYLFQSVMWLVLLAPYTLDLVPLFPSPTLAVLIIATGVWLVSVIGAALLHHVDTRGPAERVLRRLTYGPRT